MIQCCLCEDWFHDNHLELSTSVPKTYQEMVCLSCIRRHQFLLNYVTYHSPESAPTISIGKQVHKLTPVTFTRLAVFIYTRTPCVCWSSRVLLLIYEILYTWNTTEKNLIWSALFSEPDDNGKTPIDAESDGNTQSSPVKPTSNSSDETCATHSDPMCNKLRLKTDLPARTLFMLDGWREGLCRCCPCLEYYKTEQIGEWKELLPNESVSYDSYRVALESVKQAGFQVKELSALYMKCSLISLVEACLQILGIGKSYASSWLKLSHESVHI